MHRVSLQVTGRVQGVGFRWFVQRRAEERGIHGTVRNRADGAVEIEAEGALEALRTFVVEVRRGPTHARVEALAEQWDEGPARYRQFEVTG